MTVAGLVSVVVPAHQKAAFIAETIATVRDQSYPSWELIVVDDGSTDATAAIAAELGATVIRQPNRGPAAARNAGLARARGEYWMICDADDLLPPDRLRHQVTYLLDHPDQDMVTGLTEAFTTPGQPRPAHWNPAWDAGPHYGLSTASMARATTLRRVGPFNESLLRGEDVEWHVRALRAGVRIGRLDELCLRYRIRPDGLSSCVQTNRLAMTRALHAALRSSRIE